MTEKTINTFKVIINILIILYFGILVAERTQSIVRAGSKKVLFTDGIHNYMAGLCFFSFFGTLVLCIAKAVCLSRFSQGNLTQLQNPSRYATVQLVLLCMAVGCILLSGMVHTEYSIPGIQFAAYGMLILAMVFHVIIQQDILTMGKRALTLLYIVAFSMAIPVVYPSEMKQRLMFHIAEAIVSFVLVLLFSILLYALFSGNYELILHPAFIIIALVGDILVLALRWNEQINWFVLVSLVVAAVTWVAAAFYVRPAI